MEKGIKLTMDSTILGKIAKNQKGDYIVVSRTNYKDKTSIDIRNFYTSDKGEVLPTKKGVNIESELLVDVLALIVNNLSSEELIDFEDRVSETLKNI